MIKQSVIAAGALFAAVVGFQPAEQAQAGVKFHLHFGHGYGYHHFYTPRVYYKRHYYVPRHRHYHYKRISCWKGKSIVRGHGFHHVRAIDCHGSVYKFKGKKWGQWFVIKMKSRNGWVFSKYRI